MKILFLFINSLSITNSYKSDFKYSMYLLGENLDEYEIA
jgi:hypothetical protein